MAVSNLYNEVNSKSYEIEPSIMSSRSDSIWCEYSINVINYNADMVLEDGRAGSVKRFFDRWLGIRVVGSLGEGVEDVEIKLFPHKWYDYALKANSVVSGTTDSNGVLLFTRNPYTIRDADQYRDPPFGLTYSLMQGLITYDGQKRYVWLPFTDYQNMYFVNTSDTAFVIVKLQTMTSVKNDYLNLFPNFPNPFNGSTNICFDIKRPVKVDIDIYNMLGQKRLTLFSGNLGTGLHCYHWDGEEQASGVYFVKVRAGGQAVTQKMTLLK